MPGLRRVPGIRRLFSNEDRAEINTETIVLITPHVVTEFSDEWNTAPIDTVDDTVRNAELEAQAARDELVAADPEEEETDEAGTASEDSDSAE